jgi:hypothetical protein
MKIHPRFNGGDISRSYLSDGLHVTVHKPVYNGLQHRGRHGFVQIRFAPIQAMPDTIRETIDFDVDGQADLDVTIIPKTGVTEMKPINPVVQKVSISSPLKTDWVIRVDLHRETEKPD